MVYQKNGLVLFCNKNSVAGDILQNGGGFLHTWNCSRFVGGVGYD